MGLKGALARALKQKLNEYKEKKEEEKILKQIYQTRLEALKRKEMRRQARLLAAEHARKLARKEVKQKFQLPTQKTGGGLLGQLASFGEFASQIPIAQEMWGIQPRRTVRRKKRRKKRR